MKTVVLHLAICLSFTLSADEIYCGDTVHIEDNDSFDLNYQNPFWPHEWFFNFLGAGQDGNSRILDFELESEYCDGQTEGFYTSPNGCSVVPDWNEDVSKSCIEHDLCFMKLANPRVYGNFNQHYKNCQVRFTQDLKGSCERQGDFCGLGSIVGFYGIGDPISEYAFFSNFIESQVEQFRYSFYRNEKTDDELARLRAWCDLVFVDEIDRGYFTSWMSGSQKSFVKSACYQLSF